MLRRVYPVVLVRDAHRATENKPRRNGNEIMIDHDNAAALGARAFSRLEPLRHVRTDVLQVGLFDARLLLRFPRTPR